MNMPAMPMTSTARLDQLLDGMAVAPPVEIGDITLDSRKVVPGGLFLAVQGMNHHGLDYLDMVLARGAAAVAYDGSGSAATTERVPMIPVAGLVQQLGEVANRYFDHPSQHIAVYGVTGTNGKSTVAWMLAQAWSLLGRQCAYAGTLGYGVEELATSDEMTTPDVLTTHRRLAEFRDAGASAAAIEVSSHALDQGRVDGVRFKATLFTNLSRDHLDYHGDMLAYGSAKARLFDSFAARFRVINIDSEFGEQLASRELPGTVRVSIRPDRVPPTTPYLYVNRMTAHGRGYSVECSSHWGDAAFELPLVGEFNVANAAGVLALLLAEGVAVDAACAVMEALSPPPGRMQNVIAGQGPAVYIDYAHTPDALDNALRALRPHCAGKLNVVFGCGGDRDKGKRPEMASIAEALADRVVICNDNPRSEDPQAIIEGILAGLATPASACVIEDRGAAIAWAIDNAAQDDVVLIAGKGHENYQLIGAERRNFSDYATAAANLARNGSPA